MTDNEWVDESEQSFTFYFTDDASFQTNDGTKQNSQPKIHINKK